ncbi:Purine catabolism protein PucB [Clostridium liquoris]|uniref:Purine catabolism protein PucB n=1 Tax=Clostridium liquoris TaxID=1289519 RepID=A0A2T0B0Q9_9CLOT|nr:NTP transferase domain-containing protein [Clostridium liquoris]PRR77164.1 Purine catabolism protein PucB [Clostridium liquoris]
MISAIVMASGFGRRMKKEKLAMTIENIPMVERVVKEAKNSKVGEIILVYRNSNVKSILNGYHIKTIYNNQAYLGQSQSIKLGVKGSNNKTEAYMFFVGDQPYLKCDTINKLIDEFNKDKDHIVVPIYGENRGNPVIFPVKFKEDLLKLQGDIGARGIIKDNINSVKFINIRDEKQGRDIDDVESYCNLETNDQIIKHP